MQIRMLDTWAYDVVPGQIRRTLPAGQTFDEPVEIAQAAIAAGAAERIVAIAPVADDVEAAEVDLDLDAGDDDQDEGEPGNEDDGDDAGDGEQSSEGDGQPHNEADPASPAPVTSEAPVPAKSGRARKAAAVVPAPAEPVEPA